jgi:seryl-tRNA synthetase
LPDRMGIAFVRILQVLHEPLTDPGHRNMALINYGIAFLLQRKYTPVQPPFFLNRDQMAKTAQLSQFDEELYHVTEGAKADESDVKYLIATSEQPLSCKSR